MNAAVDEGANGGPVVLDDPALAAEVARAREKLFRQLGALCGSAWEGELTRLDDASLARIRRELGEGPGEDE